ncbi:MAG: hypothetical protein IJE89_00220 [Bacilli bacterium]|nr:hypothetical protein [Bacilli bacterium]
MYSLKNKKDIDNILKYHRAKDMVNIMTFFPRLSPVDDLVVILDEEDYIKNKDRLLNLTSIRNGNPINEPCMKSIPVKEIDPNYIEVIKEIKKENKNGILILFHLNVKPTERYERYAGISIGISLGKTIYIDAVGKGFDGREVLKGISCHERYSIPWSDIRKINIDNFKNYNTFIISKDNYLKSREERINYLVSCGLSQKELDDNIPKKYKEIPDFIWLDIIKNIIKPLEKEEDFLRSCGFLEFNLSGHTEGKRFRPWQMVDDKRM